jgi:hypothetical protein
MFQTEIIGHLHPILVHLPIGIVIFAYIMMILQQFRKIDMNAAIDLALLLGTLSSAFACIAGWFLAKSGDYETDAIFKHQWTGIGTAILGFLAYFFKKHRFFFDRALLKNFDRHRFRYGIEISHFSIVLLIFFNIGSSGCSAHEPPLLPMAIANFFFRIPGRCGR